MNANFQPHVRGQGAHTLVIDLSTPEACMLLGILDALAAEMRRPGEEENGAHAVPKEPVPASSSGASVKCPTCEGAGKTVDGTRCHVCHGDRVVLV